jgi:hypothetical protein
MLKRYNVLFTYSYVDEFDQKHELKNSVTEIYNKGRLIPLRTNLENEDYERVDYVINNELYNGNNYSTQGADTIEEVYVLNKYNITYNLDNGIVDDANPTVYTVKTGTITLNNPHKNKYEFLGWTWTGQTEPVMDVSFESTDKENKAFTANFHLLDVPAKVIYEQMNVDGNGYTPVYEDTVMLQPGSTWTPEVIPYEGFTSPAAQTVTVDPDGNTVVTYQYIRNKYKLTVNNSAFVDGNASGEYYYGTDISLEADDNDDLGAPFEKWITGELGQTLAFTMPAHDVTTMPCYGVQRTLTLEYNGGFELDTMFEGPLVGQYYRGEPIDYPELIKETCEIHGDGAPETRGCEYYAEFLGWFTDVDLENEVPANYVMPDTDTTLYAGWNGLYYHYTFEGEKTFGGSVDEVINTGVNVYNIENSGRDFTISFDILEIDSYNPENQATIMNAKDEQNIIPGTGNIVPGVVVRLINNNNNQFELRGAWNRRNVEYKINRSMIPMHMEIYRVDGVVKVRYCSIDENGECTGSYTEKEIYDESTWTPPHPSKLNVTFGCSQDQNGNYYRFFRGKLANMEVKVDATE